MTIAVCQCTYFELFVFKQGYCEDCSHDCSHGKKRITAIYLLPTASFSISGIDRSSSSEAYKPSTSSYINNGNYIFPTPNGSLATRLSIKHLRRTSKKLGPALIKQRSHSKSFVCPVMSVTSQRLLFGYGRSRRVAPVWFAI
ncbi:hypothetical protein WG66_012823 [Moniliophthora roreri]|nr:hypothetical protein WG66_012823 [Moniliophthora roreri]